MRTSYLTPDDVAEFVRRFPQADAFLLDRSLKGELRYLRGLLGPTPGQQARRAELEALEASIASYTPTERSPA